MKKIKTLLLMIVLLSTLVVSVFSLTSCNKTVTYQIAGLYIELVEQKEMTIEDSNPKIYFKYDNNNILSQKSGSYASITNTSKSVKEENDAMKYYFATDVLVAKDKYKNIKVHLIFFQNGKYIVENDVHDTIASTGTSRYSANYTFKNQKYRLDFEVRIKNR